MGIAKMNKRKREENERKVEKTGIVEMNERKR